jgi:hypothetical protein
MPERDKPKKRRRARAAHDGPLLPLFMTASRSRLTEQVRMSAGTFKELQNYLGWAGEAARVSPDEAQVMTLDRAIGDYLKRDEAWQLEKARRNVGVEDVSGAASPGATAAPPSQTPKVAGSEVSARAGQSPLQEPSGWGTEPAGAKSK